VGAGLKALRARAASAVATVASKAQPEASDPSLLAHADLNAIVTGLRTVRSRWRLRQQRTREWGGREFPSQEIIADAVDQIRGALFPMRLGPTSLRQEAEDFYVGDTLDRALVALNEQVRLELAYASRASATDAAQLGDHARELTRKFALSLPRIRELLDTDVQAAFDGDPAARSVDEVLLCYPGVHAMIYHRIANRLYTLGAPLIARIIAELAHSKTGIDIHPGASIGAGFFMDHGTGIVIGETAVIGERVRLYQAVTLGAKRFPTDENGRLEKSHLRHPIVEDDVVIYAGATVLGRITIGRGATIGGNVWVTRDVASGSHVTQATSLHEVAAPKESAARK
jgi:serine O-acetyltransferase